MGQATSEIHRAWYEPVRRQRWREEEDLRESLELVCPLEPSGRQMAGQSACLGTSPLLYTLKT
jgi:hypothetical protein